LPTRDLDRLINVLRDATGTMGHTMAHTRELAWWSGRFGTRVDVSVVPEADRTTVRVTSDTRRALYLRAGAALSTAAMAGALTGVILSQSWGVFEPVAVLSGITVGLTWLVKGGRWYARRGTARIAQEATGIAERLATRVRESIDSSKPR
jgi:hypothetical protein